MAGRGTLKQVGRRAEGGRSKSNRHDTYCQSNQQSRRCVSQTSCFAQRSEWSVGEPVAEASQPRRPRACPRDCPRHCRCHCRIDISVGGVGGCPVSNKGASGQRASDQVKAQRSARAVSASVTASLRRCVVASSRHQQPSFEKLVASLHCKGRDVASSGLAVRFLPALLCSAAPNNNGKYRSRWSGHPEPRR